MLERYHSKMRSNFPSRFRFPSLCAALFLACVVTGLAEPLSPAAIKTLLDQIRQRRATSPYVQADFREEKILRLMNQPITTAGRVWFQPPGRIRREIKGNSPSLMVSDGQQLWIYYPNFKSAEHYSLGKKTPLDNAMAALNTALNLENVENTFHITGNKIENGYDLELLPRTPSMKRIFQKFDLRLNNELLVVRTDMVQANGDRVLTTYSNQSRAAIPASTFEFNPPAGTDVSNPLGK